MTTSASTLSMAFVRGLVEAVEATGVPREALLRASTVAPEDLLNLELTLTRDEVDALVERAIELTGEPALGLYWWERATFGAFGVIGHALSVARSFRAGLALMENYWPLFLSRPRVLVRDEGERCTVTLDAASTSLVAHRAYMEAGAFALCRFLRQCVGVAGVPIEVSFDYPEPSYRAEYDRHLRCPLVFNAAATKLTVHSAHMDQPHLNYSAELTTQLHAYADALLAARQPQPLSSRVLRVLRTLPDVRRASMEEVAMQLGMSERTLRRRLHDEGDSFPPLAQTVLREQAEAMLRDPSRSVKEVAYALGFADPSAFHRAVRRWTGKAPRELRSSAPPPTAKEHASQPAPVEARPRERERRIEKSERPAR